MLELIIFFLNILCTNPAPHAPGSNCNGIHIITMGTDTGGETGDIPPILPPPPPPPPRN